MDALPVMIVCAAMINALTDDAQTLFTVVQTVLSASPAPRAHCLAGFCPRLHGDQTVSAEGLSSNALRREDIAKEDFLNVFRLESSTVDSSFESISSSFL